MHRCLLDLFLVVWITKIEDVIPELHTCGRLSVVGPHFADRRKTLTFIPTKYTGNSSVEWSTYSNTALPLTNSSKHTMYSAKDGSIFYLVIAEKVQYKGYFARFYQFGKLPYCWSNAVSIRNEPLPSRGCGKVFQRKPLRNGMVELWYIPSTYYYRDSEHYNGHSWIKRNSIGSNDVTSEYKEVYINGTSDSILQLPVRNGQSINGYYTVQCNNNHGDSTYTKEFEVAVPGTPKLTPVTTVAGYQECIAGYIDSYIDITCAVDPNESTIKTLIAIYIGGTLLEQEEGYRCSIRKRLEETGHLNEVTCIVRNAFTPPVIRKTTLYVKKLPNSPELDVQQITGHKAMNVSCHSTGRPAPDLVFTILNNNIAAEKTLPYSNDFTTVIQLRSIERNWYGKEIKCCALLDDGRHPYCSRQQRLPNVYPVTKGQTTPTTTIVTTKRAIHSKTKSKTSTTAGYKPNGVGATSKSPEKVGPTRHGQKTKHQTKQDIGPGVTTPNPNDDDKDVAMPTVTEDDGEDRRGHSRTQHDPVQGIEEEKKLADGGGDSNGFLGPIVGVTVGIVAIVVIVVIVLVIKRRRNTKASHPAEVRYVADGNHVDIAADQNEEANGPMYASVVPRSQRETSKPNPCPAEVHAAPSNQDGDPDQLTYADLDLQPSCSTAAPRPSEPATEYTTIMFTQKPQT